MALSTTVFIRLQAKRFLHKSSLSLGKFEAVEGVSAYNWVFFIKKKNSPQIKTVTNDVLDARVSKYTKFVHTRSFAFNWKVKDRTSKEITISIQLKLPFLLRRTTDQQSIHFWVIIKAW